MSDLNKLAGNLSAAAAQENCDSYEHDLMQEASVELRQAANLIEQQQREIESLRSRANTWNKVWGELRNTQLIKDVGYEHAKHGNCSAASILLEAFETLTEQAEDEQESLAEVRARAVEELKTTYPENEPNEHEHYLFVTNVGIQCWEGVWTTPCEESGWEPERHDEVEWFISLSDLGVKKV